MTMKMIASVDTGTQSPPPPASLLSEPPAVSLFIFIRPHDQSKSSCLYVGYVLSSASPFKNKMPDFCLFVWF